MKISDRDKKLILGVLLIAVIALPIFLFIKPKKADIAELDSSLASLNERYNYLKELSAKQPEYEAKIVELNAERDKLITGFAGGVKFENTLMFLRDLELSDNPIRAQVMTFYEDEEQPINQEGLTAIKSTTVVTYCGEYDDVKEFINYIFNYKDKMSITMITLDLDKKTNLVKGNFELNQYAIAGNGKEVPPANIPSMLHGTDRLFELILDDEGNPVTYWSSLGVELENEDLNVEESETETEDTGEVEETED